MPTYKGVHITYSKYGAGWLAKFNLPHKGPTTLEGKTKKALLAKVKKWINSDTKVQFGAFFNPGTEGDFIPLKGIRKCPDGSIQLLTERISNPARKRSLVSKVKRLFSQVTGNPRKRRNPEEKIKIYLKSVRLNRGGYDSRGRYFGVGAPLFYYQDDEGDISNHIRASSRSEAKQQILSRYPNVKFAK